MLTGKTKQNKTKTKNNKIPNLLIQKHTDTSYISKKKPKQKNKIKQKKF